MAKSVRAAIKAQKTPLPARLWRKLILGFAGFTLFSLAVSVGLGALIGYFTAETYSARTDLRHITIGQDGLNVEENAIRFQRQRVNGILPQVDLALTWPQMQGYTKAERARFDDPAKAKDLIFISISQSVMTQDMSGRIGPIYSQLFAGEPIPSPFGLQGHRFRPNLGYDGELMYIGEDEGANAYAVRCLLPSPKGASVVSNCQRDIHLGNDLSVSYRFSEDHLKDWRAIEAAVRSFVNARLTGMKAGI